MKRIVLTGTYCSKNKGDAAMRMSAAEAIKRLLPGTAITILTPFPEIDRGVYDGNPIVHCSRRKARQAVVVLLRLMTWIAVRRFLRLDLRRLVSTDELRSYVEADVIVDLSGDGLTEEYGVRCTLSHLVPVVIGLVLGKPIFLCAQTIGPFRRTLLLAKTVLNRVTAISARERLSLDGLRCSGITRPRVCLTGDMAFSLEPCTRRRARELLVSEGIGFSRPLVGVSVARLPGHALELGARQFVRGEFDAVMARVVDGLVERLGADVVFVSHATGPGVERDDREVARSVCRVCRHRSHVYVVEGDYAPPEVKGIIGETELFVGLRMHSNIAALSMGVPTVAIAYGPKALGIMAMAGQEQYVLDLRDLTVERLTELAERAWSHREGIRTGLQLSMPGVQDLSLRNIAIIAELLGAPLTEAGGTESEVTSEGGTAIAAGSS